MLSRQRPPRATRSRRLHHQPLNSKGRAGGADARFLANLPVEALAMVFALCEQRELTNRALVCKNWAAVALPIGWRTLELVYHSDDSLRERSRLMSIRNTLASQRPPFDYPSYPRNVSVSVRLYGNERSQQIALDVRIGLLASIMCSFSNLSHVKIVLDVDSDHQEHGLQFLQNLFSMKPPTQAISLTFSGLSLTEPQIRSVADHFGPVLHGFQTVNCDMADPPSIAYLCKSAPRLQSIALNVPYEGSLLQTLSAYNKRLKILGLHFRINPTAPAPPPPAPAAAGFVPQGVFQTLGTVTAGPGTIVPINGAMGGGAGVGLAGGAEDYGLATLHFADGLQHLFANGIRLTSIKISGLSIPDGDGNRILELICRDAVGLERLQMTAVRDENLGHTVESTAALYNLKSLVVSLTSVSCDFITRIARTCPQLTELRAEGTPITDACVRDLALYCRNLTILQIALCTRITCASVVSLIQHGSQKLQMLDISYCWWILRSENPLLILLWLVEDNPHLERLGLMYRPFDFATSSTVQRLAERFEVGDGDRATAGFEGAGEGRSAVHVVVGSRWLDVKSLRTSWAVFGGRYPKGSRSWWERIWRLVRGQKDLTEDERAKTWLHSS
ncbi:hypothetical protein HK104_002374 [Borealophlyctis nickersoniae]|nr:hypothetical protein HK104_002374 [Borealophlyctis nickersoniae]